MNIGACMSFSLGLLGSFSQTDLCMYVQWPEVVYCSCCNWLCMEVRKGFLEPLS